MIEFKAWTHSFAVWFRSMPIFIWLVASLWVVAAYLTTKEANRSIIASMDLWIRPHWNEILSDSLTPIESQRAIQQHYLSYGVYIPIDDIVVNARQHPNESVISMLQSACGKGIIYIWVPLPMRFPLLGEKVFEWCLVKA